jgi:hypothetical protein
MNAGPRTRMSLHQNFLKDALDPIDRIFHRIRHVRIRSVYDEFNGL